jgi:proteasome lid subunit RPN8/RPN11
LRSIRERGLAHLGIYHSHPHGKNIPSRRDIQESNYPSCVYFILAPHAETRAIRAFEIRNGRATEVEIEAVEHADVFSSPSE